MFLLLFVSLLFVDLGDVAFGLEFLCYFKLLSRLCASKTRCNVLILFLFVFVCFCLVVIVIVLILLEPTLCRTEITFSIFINKNYSVSCWLLSCMCSWTTSTSLWMILFFYLFCRRFVADLDSALLLCRSTCSKHTSFLLYF